jgi:ubiquinone/menaquinone biosynthesis C-methylase UbiE
MSHNTIRKFIYRFGWDTRRRNVDIARVLKPLLAKTPNLLDVGCGEFGLAGVVYPAQVIGLDIINKSYETAENLKFVSGSVLALPFSDQSFPVVASLDMIEHLPADLREKAVDELFRIAYDAVVIGFPFGENAQSIDRQFKQELNDASQPEPEWLTEHLENQYPDLQATLAMIERIAAKRQKKVETAVYYSENLKVTRLLRRFSLKSKKFYILMNILAGLALTNLKSDKNNSYRTILVIKIK